MAPSSNWSQPRTRLSAALKAWQVRHFALLEMQAATSEAPAHAPGITVDCTRSAHLPAKVSPSLERAAPIFPLRSALTASKHWLPSSTALVMDASDRPAFLHARNSAIVASRSLAAPLAIASWHFA